MGYHQNIENGHLTQWIQGFSQHLQTTSPFSHPGHCLLSFTFAFRNSESTTSQFGTWIRSRDLSVFFGCLAAIHYKGLSLKLLQRLRRMGFTAKGASALTFLFKKSLRSRRRVFFCRHMFGLCWNLNFIPCQKMKKRKKTVVIVKVWRANHDLI